MQKQNKLIDHEKCNKISLTNNKVEFVNKILNSSLNGCITIEKFAKSISDCIIKLRHNSKLDDDKKYFNKGKLKESDKFIFYAEKKYNELIDEEFCEEECI